MKTVLNTPYFGLVHFVLSYCIVLLFYWGTQDGMLVDDGINGLLQLQEKGLSDFWNSYNTNCFYHTFWIILYGLYSMFGTNGTAWLLFFCIMHAVNSGLIYSFVYRLLNLSASDKEHKSVALFSSLFFLVSPFMIENIAWSATHHYAFSLFFLLLTSLLFIRYLQDGKWNIYSASLFFVLFILSLTTHEISFFYPIFYTLTFLFIRNELANYIKPYTFFKGILLPLMVICLSYLVFLYQLRGTWIPHYFPGETHFEISDMLIRWQQYLYRFFAFGHTQEFEIRKILYEQWAHSYWTGAIFLLLIGLLSFLLYQFKSKLKTKQFLFLCICTLLFLIPVLHIPFGFIFEHDADRYLYFCSVFAFVALAFLFAQLPRLFGYAASILYLSLLMVINYNVCQSKKEAAIYTNAFFTQYKPIDSGRTFILNIPYTIKGHRIFYWRDGLTEKRRLHFGTDDGKNTFGIMGIVGNDMHNKMEVKKINDSTFTLQIQSTGEWYTHNMLSPTNYESEDYICTTTGELLELKIKHWQAQDRILYFKDLNFIEIK